MEKGKSSWDSSRVRLRTAHESWMTQRAIFVKESGIRSNYDEEFAHHLLRQHGAMCTSIAKPCTPSAELSGRTRGTAGTSDAVSVSGSASSSGSAPGLGCVTESGGGRSNSDVGAQPQLQVAEPPQAQVIRDPPRLTPIKIRSEPAHRSQHADAMQEEPAGPSIHFAPAVSSTPKDVAPSDEPTEGCIFPAPAASGLSKSSSRKKLFASVPLLDHTYFREPLDFPDSDSEDSLNYEEFPAENAQITSTVPQQGVDRAEDTPEYVFEEHFLDGLDVNVFDLNLGAEEDVEDFTGEEDSTEEEDEIEARAHISAPKCIAYVDRLVDLLRNIHGERCKKCNSRLQYNTVQKGTALLVKWECKNRHGSSWSSQPKFRGMFSGNLHVSASLLASGNSFQKIATMAKFTNLYFLSRTHFTNIQKLYVAPAINEFYAKKQEELFEMYRGRDVVLSGDGRADSPGYSASMMTYSFCDEEEKKILHTTTVLVQEAGGKSPNMERIGFERGLDYVKSKINVTCVVTDAHPQIAALMKRTKKYESIQHQWDIWHGCKNLMKKVSNVSQQKGCEDLQPWVPKISNHFWYSAKTCDRDVAKLAGNLNGMLHHIVDEHEWLFTTDDRPGMCQHGELMEERETAWLKPGSTPHVKLYDILHDKRFMKTLKYYTDFRHTGSLEAFHSTLLMYATKRSFFTMVGYISRVKLAVLDTNFHANRKQATTKDGKLKWRRKYNKRSKKYVVVPVPEPKSYAYMPDLITAIYSKRATTPGHISQHVSMAEDDPRRVHPTISMKRPEPTEELVVKHQSRFALNEQCPGD
ncbi:uncharacterized protein LOC121409949 [Lytechinus variegatus]|uniref:uncharacterized protein LOC121409949 n=1 Tax=Lytechinus variegatus TaxID=7654 RepID=UPI001BB2AA60|nr:uncharacterized protein LOC121409949 [Lytechinus variegatus]